MISKFKKYPIASTKKSTAGKKLLEFLGILAAVILAAILGNYVARIATSQMDNVLTIYIVGIFIGLLIGILVGTYFKRGWSKLFQWIQE